MAIKRSKNKFTGYYPGMNSSYLYDEEKGRMFLNANRCRTWDKQPQIGDIIEHDYDTESNEPVKVFINEVLVWEFTEKEQEEREKALDLKIKQQKERLGITKL